MPMETLNELRRKFEEKVRLTTSIIDDMTEENVSKLVHELWVRQLELELQNETLRNAQRTLQDLHQEHIDLFNLAPFGYCCLYKDGFILHANEPLARLLRVEKEKLLTSPFREYIFEEDRQSFDRFLHELFEKQALGVRKLRLLQAGGGSPLWCRLEGIARDDERYRDRAWLSVANITELSRQHTRLETLVKEQAIELTRLREQLRNETGARTQIDRTLQASERQYRRLADQVGDGIGIIQKGIFHFSNKALARLLGFFDNSLLGKSPIGIIHEQDRAVFRRLLEESAETTFPKSFQTRGLTRANHEIWLEGELQCLEWERNPAILLTVRDISSHKLQELAMEQEQTRLKKEVRTLKSSLKERYKFGNLIGKSATMQQLYEQILKAAATEASVFIYGESGTGKELVARTIHEMSGRREKKFIPVNCGAIPETLFESEFFGHRRGAFTGAFRDKQGFFSAAHKGTLFLDELGELTPAMQVKLLRVLDDGEYIPLGDTSVKKVDVRILAATNKNLEDLRKRGLLREDFFFRIHVFTLTIPPLRERKEDLPLLNDHFLKHFCHGEQPPAIPGDILDAFYNYDWPGNIREFQNALQRYLSGQPLNFLESQPKKLLQIHFRSEEFTRPQAGEFQNVMDGFEKKLILDVLEQHRWNKSKAAAALGIPRRTLYRKMEKYGIA